MIQEKTNITLIRPLTVADLPEVQALDGRIQGEEKPEYWKNMIGSKSVALVSETNGRITGFLLGEIRSWEFRQPPTGWITVIAVDPQYRRSGIGRQLLAEALEIFRNREIENVRTMVESLDRDLLNYFNRMGFRRGPFVELQKQLRG